MERNLARQTVIRPCRPADEAAVRSLVQPYVRQKKVLQRTLNELEELLPNAYVAEVAGQVVGFVALEIYSRKLAEIRSLAVAAEFQGRGVGKGLVEACVERARQENVLEVMAITSSEGFFRSCGFDYTLPDEKKAFFIQTRKRR
jgi:N-acetylglutamate synthase-like GNAT family acetyltransferase